MYDYIDVTQFDSYMFISSIRCFLKHSTHFSSIDVNIVYFKMMAHCVCCVWDSLERVWGSECAAGGFVVCVCVLCVCVSVCVVCVSVCCVCVCWRCVFVSRAN